MKTADLQGALLDFWVARAEGYEVDTLRDAEGICYGVYGAEDIFIGYVGASYVPSYSPSTLWAQGGPLIDKYCLTVEPYPPAWWANEPDESAVMGEDPLQAICRAVVRAAFGDEVEEAVRC